MARKRRSQPVVKGSPTAILQAATVALIGPIRREMNLAYKRVNGSSIKRLRWLLEFTALDLDSLSKGHIMDLAWDLAMFGVGIDPEVIPLREDDSQTFFTLVGSLKWIEKLSKTKIEPAVQLIVEWEEGSQDYSVNEAPIREFQKDMKIAFDLLFAREGWRITPPSKPHVLDLPNVKPTKNIRAPIIWHPLPPKQILTLRAFELIRDQADLLYICANPRCNKRFVATKKNRGKYCSPACSAYVRVNKKRGRVLS